MTFYHKVVCSNCDFVSNACGSGVVAMSPCEYTIPIFDLASGALDEFVFSEKEFGKSGDELVDWVQENGEGVIRERVGQQAVPFGLWADGEPAPTFCCPKCGEIAARFADAGF